MKKLNRHTNRSIFSRCLLLLSAGFWSACTGDFEDMNTSKTELADLTDEDLPLIYSRAQQQGSYHPSYQTAQNLFADLYAQYFATTTPNFQSDRYFTHMGWINAHWNPIYTGVVPQLKTLYESYEPETAEYALADIWWVFAFHRLSDYYGPVPYFDAGIPAQSVKYDAQDVIYDDFFKRLDQAVNTLQNHTAETPYGSYDMIYEGDVSKWIKFANTLRLRLALRISKVDPARAQSEAEAAAAAGVMTGTADDAIMIGRTQQPGDENGLARIAGWGEFRMSASMESVLKGYDDPRMTVFFQPAFGTGTYEGLRNGLTTAQLGQALNSNDNNSNVGTRWIVNTGSGSGWDRQLETPANIMHAAEAYFLRAEGALNGWNMGGGAREFYEQGILTSLEQWGFTGEEAEAYVNGTGTPIAPEDQQDSPPLSDIPVKWEDTEERQREQIGTQKWLALYPDGLEAWAEFRRSRYPKLYHVVNSVNSDVPASEFIRRFPFIDSEKVTNGEAVQEAESLLNGPDKASTPLWWDVN